jgi:type I site-specific restriction endonuclease
MMPEQKARVSIDVLLQQAGWYVCDMANANIHAARGVALREFPLNTGFGFADYLLYIDGKAAGVIEAKKEGRTLTGVEVQSARYAQGLPPSKQHVIAHSLRCLNPSKIGACHSQPPRMLIISTRKSPMHPAIA